MSLITSSLGITSSSQIAAMICQSSSHASSLHLYCSIGMLSGPVPFPFFNCFTQSFISSSDGGGTSSSSSECKTTSGSSSSAANFFSRNLAQRSSWCSLLVMAFPCQFVLTENRFKMSLKNLSVAFLRKLLILAFRKNKTNRTTNNTTFNDTNYCIQLFYKVKNPPF